LATIVALSLPFIKINENQIFLLSFDKKQLHLLGIAFDMQELYLMPFLLMLLFLGIFAVTSLGGRAWCGWACPQTIFRVIYRDLIESKLLGLRRIKNKQRNHQGE
jgi:polyferredoxin